MAESAIKMSDQFARRASFKNAALGFRTLKPQRRERLFGMENTQRGKLILKAVPTGEVEEKVVRLLIQFAKTASANELTKKVRNTPYVLSNDIEAEKALMFIEAIQKCGATAEFILSVAEKPAAKQSAPVPRPPAFSFESDTSVMDEASPPPIHVKPPKNGVRRLTMILVFILLLLSLGFLAWQLWPIIGDKVQEWITFLKDNI